ncbi:hypothetical protein EDD16DRAFT_1527489 [Pisolithus croceorrhizus]|nr:hypothetical protein EV401DRAFT_1896288 [Pisolithus croceorrhizus]KAI6097696.1 hypothetical protein EDD16DRAFT_1527489 [Pisolithus croceorrhizus]
MKDTAGSHAPIVRISWDKGNRPPDVYFSRGYKSFADEIYTDIDVEKLVHCLKACRFNWYTPLAEECTGTSDVDHRQVCKGVGISYGTWVHIHVDRSIVTLALKAPIDISKHTPRVQLPLPARILLQKGSKLYTAMNYFRMERIAERPQ